MSESLSVLSNVAILTFVLTSMAALGCSLTIGQITGPLLDVRRVGLGLLANFVAAPAAAWAVSAGLGLSDPLTLGLLLLGTAAGAPFLPKLAQIAKGDVAYSVGLMVLLMAASIAYIPLVLVPLVDGVEVGPWAIAQPLIFFMLLPLAVALAARSRYPDAERLAGPLGQVSTTALAIGAVGALAVALPDLIDTFGSGAFVGAISFIVLCVLAGYVLGGSTVESKRVLALGTGQRNVSAALLIATTSFADDADVLVMVMVGAALMLVILMPFAAELGKRTSGQGAE